MDIEVRGQIPAANGQEEEYKAKINRYVLSGDLLAGRVTRTVALDDTVTDAKSWYHLDHLNSTKCVTDEAGEVEVNYTYRAFGEQLKRLDEGGNETGDKAKYSYGGKELDDRTNLYYFNARYYDATIGRFINVDPVQDGENWYVYTSNNPMNAVGPTGLVDFKNKFYGIFLEIGNIHGEQTSKKHSQAKINLICQTPFVNFYSFPGSRILRFFPVNFFALLSAVPDI